MVETYAYTAEQARKDTEGPVSEDVLNNILNYQIKYIKASAAAGNYEAELKVTYDHKAFDEVVNRLYDMGYVVYSLSKKPCSYWFDYRVCWEKRAEEVVPHFLYDMRDDLLEFKKKLEEHEWTSSALRHEYISGGVGIHVPERYIGEDKTVDEAVKEVADKILESSNLHVASYVPIENEDPQGPNFTAYITEDETIHPDLF